MRRALTIVAFAGLISLIYAAEVRAGASAGDTYTSFSGPAFSGTAVINLDDVTTSASVPPKGTVALRVSRGNTGAGIVFQSIAFGDFKNGCDGINGASIQTSVGLEVLTNNRFLGVDWIDTAAKTTLLGKFGMTPEEFQPLVFSDISGASCTQIDGVWILSFTGTMQFGKKK
jgi:hypothetical protein